ncbi:16969_t:CDS:1, partial [Cetraspora pellucida]
MPQQKARNNATVACIDCRRRRKKCKILSGENKCTNCNKQKLPCIFIPGNKRGPKSVVKAYHNAIIANPPSPNSCSVSDSFSLPYSHSHITATNTSIYETTETFRNPQLSSIFHNGSNNDPNISFFSTNNLNGSFYQETPHSYINPYNKATPHSYINPYNEATETSQNC